MTRDFKYDTSRICWSLFEKTGRVGYYQLFKEVEFGKITRRNWRREGHGTREIPLLEYGGY